MKNKLIQLMKDEKWLIFALGITCCVFLYFAIAYNHLFMFLGDTLDQNLKFYIQGWERIHSGALPFWDWSNFLGNNYFASQTYYLIGSPFYWLTMLLPRKEYILPFFLTLTWLKSILCVLFTYKWLMRVSENKTGAATGAIAFTFSAFILFNWRHYHMLDAVIFFPLALNFIELFLSKNKYLGLALTIGAIGIIDYYFLYLLAPFLFIYALIRYFVVIPCITWKTTLIKAGKFLLIFVVGLLLCMVTLIPTYIMLQNNPRSSEFIFGFNTIGKYNIFRFITSFINPVNDWRENVNYFISTSIDEGISWGGGMCNYTFLLTPLFFIPLLWIKNIKLKLSMIVFYIIYFIFALFPMFYVIFNQNYETRWMINIVLINTMLISVLISKKEEVPKKIFAISGGFVLAALLISYFITYYFELCPEEWGMNILTRNVFLLSILMIFYIIAFTWKNKYFSIILSGCLVFEVAFSVYNLLKNDGWYLDLMSKEQLDDYSVFQSEVIDYIHSIDSGFYRIDIGSLQFVSVNDAYNYCYNSFNNYHSVYNFEMVNFVNERFIPTGRNVFFPQRGKWQLKNLLGSKYWFSHAGEEVNYNTNATLNYEDYPPYGYEYLTTIDNTDIYLNQYYLPFGYVMKETLNEKTFNGINMLYQDYLLNQYIVLETSDNTSYELPGNLIKIKSAEQSVDTVDFRNLNGGYLYVLFTQEFEVNNRSSYFIKDENGAVLKEGIRQYEVSYLGIELPKDAVSFELEVNVPYEIYYDDLNWYQDWYHNISQETFENVQWSENEIYGEITVNENSWILTSIPYSEGWSLSIDGTKALFEKANQGFIAFELTQGTHKVQFNYVPPGLILGFSISSITLILLLSYRLFQKKRYQQLS